MNVLVFALYSSIFVTYFILIVYLLTGVYKANIQNFKKANISNLRVSIIAAFRNEEENLTKFFESIYSQTIPIEKFELILINDFSEDNSFLIAKKLQAKYNELNVKILQNKISGKKNAINLGVEASEYDYLIFTDIDCVHNKNWILSMVKYFETKKSDFLIGPVKIGSDKNLFKKFQEIEFLSLQASTFGSAGNNNPILCNAANLGIKKSKYEFIKTNPKVTSGDDIFLLHSIKKDKNSVISFVNDENAIVETNAKASVSEFINQRLRWASKSKHYKDYLSILISLIVVLTNLSVLIFPFFLNSNWIYILIAGLIMQKFLIDFIFLKSINKLYKSEFNIFSFLLFEITYCIYITLISLFIILGVTPKWKGRTV